MNNVLYLNDILFWLKKVDSPLFSYFNKEEETPLHLFHSCLKTKQLRNRLRQYFSQFINISHATPQSSLLRIFDTIQHSELINQILLILKFCIYSERNTKQLTFDNLKIKINKIKETEKELTSFNKRKLLKKWHLLILWLIDTPFKMKREGAGASNFISFSFLFSIFYLFFIFLFLCLSKQNCSVLSCFISFIFNSFVISYWIYFLVTERKKTNNIKEVIQKVLGWLYLLGHKWWILFYYSFNALHLCLNLKK